MLNKATVALCALMLLASCKNRNSAHSSYANENEGKVTKEHTHHEATENVVYFAFDSSKLDMSEENKLDNSVAMLEKHHVKNLTVEGHCDHKGSREYNIALGERRADKVAQYIKKHYKHSDLNVSTVSYGKDRPAVTGDSSEVDALNRRAVIVNN